MDEYAGELVKGAMAQSLRCRANDHEIQWEAKISHLPTDSFLQVDSALASAGPVLVPVVFACFEVFLDIPLI